MGKDKTIGITEGIIIKIIADSVDKKARDISVDDSLSNLGFGHDVVFGHSTNHLGMAYKLEEEFKIDIDIDDLFEFKTVKDVINYVLEKIR